ncbi:hypothetical protein HL658_31305 [Azospirillum sp. RWY-5-1]|uniref:Transcriptional regulator n=1 Tax=Azospirillum oleiclasticum TaxID=2735135 RepID=A0ABX2TMD5_9PROT|nr:hypothetical protein [Azospirillum oleiclasticum]NYZ17053.1 hypothetical protein [Azospirillum oleiclasticum]NYZ24503.1 hypothetical protein [Azospirillum oleiclasticum]
MALDAEGLAWLRSLRLSMLIAAFKSPGRSIKEGPLHRVLTGNEHFRVARAEVERQMRHLASLGLVWCDETGHDLVLSLTDDGIDLVLGRGGHPEVDSPSPGTARRMAMAAAAEIARKTLGDA